MSGASPERRKSPPVNFSPAGFSSEGPMGFHSSFFSSCRSRGPMSRLIGRRIRMPASGCRRRPGMMKKALNNLTETEIKNPFPAWQWYSPVNPRADIIPGRWYLPAPFISVAPAPKSLRAFWGPLWRFRPYPSRQGGIESFSGRRAKGLGRMRCCVSVLAPFFKGQPILSGGVCIRPLLCDEGQPIPACSYE